MLTIDAAYFANLPFQEAALQWMEMRKQRPRLKPRTHESTAGYLDALSKFFTGMRLREISAGALREYQLARTANAITIRRDGASVVEHPWRRPAGHSVINHELCVMAMMLRHAGLWERLRPYYSPLAVPSWSPREILTEEQEKHLFAAAAGDREAQLAYWIAAITNNTTAAGSELRGLRLQDVYLREPQIERGIDQEPSEIYIPAHAVKNESRPRRIALNSTARWAVEQCYRRALALGSTRPEDYLFPFRVGPHHYDPTRPASRWFLRKSWDRLRAITGLAELCPHDLRHQCITRMLEAGVAPETVRAVAGHVTEAMMQYYSHIRRQAKYSAVMAIEPGLAPPAKKKPARSAAVGSVSTELVTEAHEVCA